MSTLTCPLYSTNTSAVPSILRLSSLVPRALLSLSSKLTSSSASPIGVLSLRFLAPLSFLLALAPSAPLGFNHHPQAHSHSHLQGPGDPSTRLSYGPLTSNAFKIKCIPFFFHEPCLLRLKPILSHSLVKIRNQVLSIVPTMHALNPCLPSHSRPLP